MEDLIKTYTNENETILDFTMGSGTKDDKYFEISKQRINI